MSTYILSATRTAVGSFGGALKPLNAVQMGALAITEALKRAGVAPEAVGDVVMGNVLQAGSGQNVARLAALKAGLPYSTPAHTPNQVCGSGLKAIALGAQSILMGDADLVVAGGTESMSNAPYLLPAARWGARMGNTPLIDSMIQDGLWCGHGDTHMGITAENVAAKHGITREAQDAFALRSQREGRRRPGRGRVQGRDRSRSPAGKKGDTIVNARRVHQAGRHGRGPGRSSARLQEGRHRDRRQRLRHQRRRRRAWCWPPRPPPRPTACPSPRILGFATAGVDPATMGLGPVPAIQKLLAKTGVTLADIDLFELNEAFAAQSLGVLAELPGSIPPR